jgi:hypothetical protein
MSERSRHEFALARGRRKLFIQGILHAHATRPEPDPRAMRTTVLPDSPGYLTDFAG